MSRAGRPQPVPRSARTAGSRQRSGRSASGPGLFSRLRQDDSLHLPTAIGLILVAGLGFGYALGNAVVKIRTIQQAAVPHLQDAVVAGTHRPASTGSVAATEPDGRRWITDGSGSSSSDIARHGATGSDRLRDLSSGLVTQPRTVQLETRQPAVPGEAASEAIDFDIGATVPAAPAPKPEVGRFEVGRLEVGGLEVGGLEPVEGDRGLEPVTGSLAGVIPAVAGGVPGPGAIEVPTKPAWQHYAVPFRRPAGAPAIAVVIDDLGMDRRGSARAVQLPGPVTLAILPYAEDLQSMADAARRRGHELLVHMPMEPSDPSVDPGPDALLTSLDAAGLQRRLAANLARFDGFVGINNHMGSRFTASAPHMAQVMAELRRRGLLYLDSRTVPETVGRTTARRYGLPTAERDVFLDNDPSIRAVFAQLKKVEQIARSEGQAIAIGHPHDATLTALEGWLPTLAARGFVLAPISAVVDRPTEVAQRPAEQRPVALR